MEKAKWERFYQRISVKYEKYYENYLIYITHARKNKKKARREISNIINWTAQSINNNVELKTILRDVSRKLRVNSRLIYKPEYYLEIVEEVLRVMLDKMEKRQTSDQS